MVYFDNNSTTRPNIEVTDVVANALRDNWANPSSPHRLGTRVRLLIESAREEIAESLGVLPSHLFFTSGATESNNAVLSWAERNATGHSSSVIISSIEHSSILEPAQHYYPRGLNRIPVNESGRVEPSIVDQMIEETKPSLVSLMAAHNETGVLQPWEEVAQICKKRNIWFHCDATQWIGKLDPGQLNQCSSFSFSAHKFGGPKGVGALVSSLPVSMIKGGGQEMEARAGTENFSGIEGMRTAWKLNCSSLSTKDKEVSWKHHFEDTLLNRVPQSKIIGRGIPRLWNTTLVCLPEFDSLSWVSKLDKYGYSVSTGSACSTARSQPSSLSGAIGLSESEGRRLVRISSYLENKEQDWLGLSDAFGRAFDELKTDREAAGILSL